MTIAHSPHAPLNQQHPEPVGVCDRCGFLYPMSKLTDQMQWSGSAITKLGLLVCPRDLDELQENGFRTIVIGPDPKPLKRARPPYWKEQAGPDTVQFVLDDPVDGTLDGPGTL